jgi:hypothetical protein
MKIKGKDFRQVYTAVSKVMELIAEVEFKIDDIIETDSRSTLSEEDVNRLDVLINCLTDLNLMYAALNHTHNQLSDYILEEYHDNHN